MKFSKFLKDRKYEIFGTVIVLILFIVVSLIVQQYLPFLEKLMNDSWVGVFVYIAAGIFATVFAPVSSVPLLPVAVQLWGWQTAAIISIFAWWIGALLAFLIARYFGVKIVEKMIPMEKLREYEEVLPTSRMFIGIIIIRLLLPADVMSYVLGLFSRVSFFIYATATLIGSIPIAFVLAYIGSMSIELQIIGFIIFTLLFIVVVYYFYNYVEQKKINLNKDKIK